MDTAISTIPQQLVCSNIAREGEIRGCSSGEIESLERKCRCAFPEAYKCFLAVMGKGAGAYMLGTDIFYGRISEFGLWLADAIRETRDPVAIPDDAFVFMSHQGYVFCYFRLSEGDDPPVYQYIQGSGKVQREHDSFTLFLHRTVQSTLAMFLRSEAS